MTWHHSVSSDGSSMDVWDHTGSLITTMQNDGSGFNKNDVLDVMFDAAVAAYQDAGGTVDDYVLRCLADAAFEQIEEGIPPGI